MTTRQRHHRHEWPRYQPASVSDTCLRAVARCFSMGRSLENPCLVNRTDLFAMVRLVDRIQLGFRRAKRRFIHGLNSSNKITPGARLERALPTYKARRRATHSPSLPSTRTDYAGELAVVLVHHEGERHPHCPPSRARGRRLDRPRAAGVRLPGSRGFVRLHRREDFSLTPLPPIRRSSTSPTRRRDARRRLRSTMTPSCKCARRLRRTNARARRHGQVYGMFSTARGRDERLGL